MISTLRMPRWNDVLVEIYNTHPKYRYCQKLNRGVKASTNHIRAIVELLDENNLIEIFPTKKIRFIKITGKGESVAILLLELRTALRCNQTIIN
ncbi:hypothetical protein JYT44_02530 [Caldithrix abyssi]|nr:hypothetical protein [Caldithrix abyssi]